MTIYNNLIETIGDTPLVKLNKFSSNNNQLYAKLESFNPAGSIKDRAVLSMINDAESKGILKENGLIVESTSGNTGIALAMIASIKNYKAILVMPDTMSKERVLYMKAYGAEIILTPGSEGMSGSNKKAVEISKERNALLLQQFDNPANPPSHRATTGREILRDLPGVDYIVAGFGTGGTVTGIGELLKDVGSNAKMIGVEPFESPFISKGISGPHKIQGIGADFIPGNLNQSLMSEIITIKSDDAMKMTKKLAINEGIFVGISSGAAMCAALELSKREENKKIVVIMPDGGDKYISMGVFD